MGRPPSCRLSFFRKIITLIQTKKISDFPVILFGSDYWGGLIDWLKNVVLAENNILREDVESIHITDDPQKVRDIVVEYHDRALQHGARSASPSQ